MKVILFEDVRGLGKRYDVREVNDGYARNFLFPNRLAKLATHDALRELKTAQARLEGEESALKKHLEALAERIATRTILFELKTDDATGAVFGSVNKEAILKAVRDAGLITTERIEIKLDHPLKRLGDYEVEIDLKKGIRMKLKITLQKQA